MGNFRRINKDRSTRKFEPSGRREYGRTNDKFSRNSYDGPREPTRRDVPYGEDRELHSIVCDKCGRTSAVPFSPTPGKPVFCDNCFRKRDKPKEGSSEDLREINVKLDKIMRALKIV